MKIIVRGHDLSAESALVRHVENQRVGGSRPCEARIENEERKSVGRPLNTVGRVCTRSCYVYEAKKKPYGSQPRREILT
jgi:hypothetical protein